jgi:hypothetical protein
MCFNIFEPVYVQVELESVLLPFWMREEVFCEPPEVASQPTSVHDLPNEILLHILSFCAPEDVCFTISKVCKWWNALAKDVTLWKSLSYQCHPSSDFSRIAEVRCSALLGFRTN